MFWRTNRATFFFFQKVDYQNQKNLDVAMGTKMSKFLTFKMFVFRYTRPAQKKIEHTSSLVCLIIRLSLLNTQIPPQKKLLLNKQVLSNTGLL